MLLFLYIVTYNNRFFSFIERCAGRQWWIKNRRKPVNQSTREGMAEHIAGAMHVFLPTPSPQQHFPAYGEPCKKRVDLPGNVIGVESKRRPHDTIPCIKIPSMSGRRLGWSKEGYSTR